MLSAYEAWLLTSVLFGVVAALIAKAMGRDPIRWFFAGFAINVFVLATILLVDRRNRRSVG